MAGPRQPQTCSHQVIELILIIIDTSFVKYKHQTGAQ